MKASLKTPVAKIAKAVVIYSCIWSTIELVCYLVKEDPFNWLSIWIFIIFSAIMLFAVAFSIHIQIHFETSIYEDDEIEETNNFEQKIKAKLEERKQRNN